MRSVRQHTQMVCGKLAQITPFICVTQNTFYTLNLLYIENSRGFILYLINGKIHLLGLYFVANFSYMRFSKHHLREQTEIESKTTQPHFDLSR